MAEAYNFRLWRIRSQMVEALEAYVKDGRPVGDFLQAILRNDFVEACALADDDNLANIQAYAAYLYNEVPRMAWGSRKNIESWIELCETQRREG